MKQLQYVKELLAELQQVLLSVDDTQAEALCGAILAAPKIFVAGSGRSGLSSKAFAMRLMHMGFSVYVIGEIVTPSFHEGDLLIVCSGSGETQGQIIMAQKAKAFGGKLAHVTIAPGSTIGAMADLELFIKAPTPKLSKQGVDSIQPMASLFEQCLLLTLDILIVKLMHKKGMAAETMFGRHVNLE